MVNCAAFGCNFSKSKKGISHFRFPLNNKKLLKEWILRVKRKNFKPTKYTTICQRHFEADCFEMRSKQEFLDSIGYKSANRRKLTLKPGSIPTIFTYAKPPKPRLLSEKRRRKSELTDIIKDVLVPDDIDIIWQAGDQTLTNEMKLLESSKVLNASESITEIITADTNFTFDSPDVILCQAETQAEVINMVDKETITATIMKPKKIQTINFRNVRHQGVQTERSNTWPGGKRCLNVATQYNSNLASVIKARQFRDWYGRHMPSLIPKYKNAIYWKINS